MLRPAAFPLSLLAGAILLIASGCSDSGPFTVEVEIDAPAPGATVLAGDAVSFEASVHGGMGAKKVSWDFGGAAPPSSAQNPGPTVLGPAGVYTVTCKAEDSLGASDTAQVTVTVKDMVAEIVSPATGATVIAGGSLTFDGNVRGGTGPFTYAWDFDGAAPASAVEDPGAVFFHAVRTHTVTFTVTDAASAQDTATVEIHVQPLAATRTQADIKAYWEAIEPSLSSVTFAMNPVLTVDNTAFEGVLEPGLVDEGVAWVNFYRWLAGLPDTVTEDTLYRVRCQKGAHVLVMLETNGDSYASPHSPPVPSGATPGYESDIYGGPANLGSNTGGWIACASGNIYRGWGGSVYTPVRTVDGYMVDTGNDATLGHRRWILYPRLTRTAFGAIQGSGVWASVMYVVERPSFSAPAPAFDFVAYPSAGFYPLQCFTGATAIWSFSANSTLYDLDGLTQVEVVRGSDGTNLGVTTQIKTAGYGITPTIGFDPGEAAKDETYYVTVRDIYDKTESLRFDHAYTVTFFDLTE